MHQLDLILLCTGMSFEAAGGDAKLYHHSWRHHRLYLGSCGGWYYFCLKPIIVYQARALRALGLLLADGTPTVGGGKTF